MEEAIHEASSKNILKITSEIFLGPMIHSPGMSGLWKKEISGLPPDTVLNVPAVDFAAPLSTQKYLIPRRPGLSLKPGIFTSRTIVSLIATWHGFLRLRSPRENGPRAASAKLKPNEAFLGQRAKKADLLGSDEILRLCGENSGNRCFAVNTSIGLRRP